MTFTALTAQQLADLSATFAEPVSIWYADGLYYSEWEAPTDAHWITDLDFQVDAEDLSRITCDILSIIAEMEAEERS